MPTLLQPTVTQPQQTIIPITLTQKVVLLMRAGHRFTKVYSDNAFNHRPLAPEAIIALTLTQELVQLTAVGQAKSQAIKNAK